MYRSFYGLTAVNLIMNKVNTKQLKETLIKYPSYVQVLRDDFYNLSDFMENYPTTFRDIEGKRLSLQLRRETDETKISEIKAKLEGMEKVLSQSVMLDGQPYNISNEAYLVLKFLFSQKSRIDSIVELLKNSMFDSDTTIVKVLNKPLYSVANFNSLRLNKLLYSKFNRISIKEKVALIERTLETLESVEEESNVDVSNLHSIDFNVYRSNLSVERINEIIGFNPSQDLDQLYTTGKELFSIGLIGFNPFIEEFYEEFKYTEFNSASKGIALGEDVKVLARDLREMLDCYKEVSK